MNEKTPAETVIKEINNNNNNNIHLFKHNAWVPKLKAYGVVCTNDINQIILNEMQVFGGEGKTELPGKKPLRAKNRTNKLNPHVTPSLGIKPWPHWREASALNTMPPLLITNIAIIVHIFSKRSISKLFYGHILLSNLRIVPRTGGSVS